MADKSERRESTLSIASVAYWNEECKFNELYTYTLFYLNVSFFFFFFLIRPLKTKYGSRAACTKVTFTVGILK